MAPVFSDDKEEDFVEGARTRVQAQDPQVDRGVVVIHDASPHEPSVDSQPPVVNFRNLMSVMTEDDTSNDRGASRQAEASPT